MPETYSSNKAIFTTWDRHVGVRAPSWCGAQISKTAMGVEKYDITALSTPNSIHAKHVSATNDTRTR
ncbi:hypothetical protein BC938DRAFT_476740 [Jimgerdemannia flammicorona]|uniref:Uncharacterized protein n=1 Tax=Jimgerdemannia flammicorona TaxID=994334 RepID=A0A433QQA4_9FUNG|nr:hypothetical protein BC938DRAFT_476740 [Jimgerdemannia flammicorona]